MTPQGFIRISPDQAQWILAKNPASAVLKVNGMQEKVCISDLLSQVIYKIVPYRSESNHIFLFTNTPSEAERSAYQPCIEYEQMAFDLSHRR